MIILNIAQISTSKKSFGVFFAAIAATAIMTMTSSGFAQSAYVENGNSSRTDEELAAMPDPEQPSGSSRRIPANKGFQMAFGTGYSIPFGSVDASMDQSEFMSGQIPLLLDLGMKTSQNQYFGVYVGVGFAQAGSAISSTCATPGVDCSLTTFRLGINWQYHIQPKEKVNPYIGLGTGLETASLSAKGPGGTADLSVFGLELLRLGLGFDYRHSKSFGFGPYMDLGIGTYTNLTLDNQSGEIAGSSLHGWLNFGVRAVLFP